MVTEGPSSPLERRELAHTSQAAYAIGTNKGTGSHVLTKWGFDGTTVTVAHPDVSTWLAAAGDTVWARSAAGKLLVSHEASPGFVELTAALPGGKPVINTLAVRENDLFAFLAEGDEVTLYRVTDAGAVSVARTGICKGARHLTLSAASIVWICPGLAVMRAPLLT